MRKAFSLVELSIVLVILGLLTGGILAGQSLIRAAELRAVTTEYQRYYTATQAFRDKYFALPGDWNNAQAVWGVQGTNCSGTVTTLTTTGTCNGDNSNTIDFSATNGGTAEAWQYWRQLALAGLIEGSYTGISGTNWYDYTAGTNVPKSKMNGAAWAAANASNYAGDTTTYKFDYGNMLKFIYLSSAASTPVLKPEEAWNIDTKMDDGLPGAGKIIAWNPNGWYNASTNPTTCTLSTANTGTPGTYNLSVTSAQCSLYFPKSI